MYASPQLISALQYLITIREINYPTLIYLIFNALGKNVHSRAANKSIYFLRHQNKWKPKMET